jgi:hypothetical protein
MWQSPALDPNGQRPNLAAQDYITVTHDGWIYPFGRGEFDALEQQAREPRRSMPLYAG